MDENFSSITKDDGLGDKVLGDDEDVENEDDNDEDREDNDVALEPMSTPSRDDTVQLGV